MFYEDNYVVLNNRHLLKVLDLSTFSPKIYPNLLTDKKLIQPNINRLKYVKFY